MTYNLSVYDNHQLLIEYSEETLLALKNAFMPLRIPYDRKVRIDLLVVYSEENDELQLKENAKYSYVLSFNLVQDE